MILVTENDSRQGIFLLDCHFVVCLLCHVRGWVRWGVVCVCGYGGGEDVALAAGQTGRGYNQGGAGWLTGRRLPPHGEHQPKPT